MTGGPPLISHREIPELLGVKNQADGSEISFSPTPGIDPDTLDAVGNTANLTQEQIDALGRHAELGDQAIQDLDESDKKNEKDIKGLGDAANHGLDKLSGMSPTNQMPSMPSMPNSAPSMPLSSLPGATQNQLGSASNLPELLNALANAQEGPDGGMYYNGTKVGDALGGQTPVDADERSRRVQEMTNKLVAANIPYAYGGGGPGGPGYGGRGLNETADAMGDYNKVGFDCSSLAQYVLHNAFGVDIPRTSEAQYAAGVPISASQLLPGDLVFGNFHSGGPGHVQIYVGHNTVCEAPSSGQYVKFTPLSNTEFRRFVA